MFFHVLPTMALALNGPIMTQARLAGGDDPDELLQKSLTDPD